MLPVVWLPEAAAELMEAVSRYSGIRPELGERFAKAVDDTVEILTSNPLHFAVVAKGRRRAGVWRFPYGLFFIVESTRIVIIACFHGKRNPRRWKPREL